MLSSIAFLLGFTILGGANGEPLSQRSLSRQDNAELYQEISECINPFSGCNCPQGYALIVEHSAPFRAYCKQMCFLYDPGCSLGSVSMCSGPIEYTLPHCTVTPAITSTCTAVGYNFMAYKGGFYCINLAGGSGTPLEQCGGAAVAKCLALLPISDSTPSSIDYLDLVSGSCYAEEPCATETKPDCLAPVTVTVTVAPTETGCGHSGSDSGTHRYGNQGSSSTDNSSSNGVLSETSHSGDNSGSASASPNALPCKPRRRHRKPPDTSRGCLVLISSIVKFVRC